MTVFNIMGKCILKRLRKAAHDVTNYVKLKLEKQKLVPRLERYFLVLLNFSDSPDEFISVWKLKKS